MNQIDDILEQAKSMIPETYTAILAREVERLRAIAPKEGEQVVSADEIELLRLLRSRVLDTAPAGELRVIAKDSMRAAALAT